MTIKKVYFIGFLSNVNSTILKMKFDNGFLVKSLNPYKTEDKEFLVKLEKNDSFFRIYSDLFMKYHCLQPNENKLYCISNEFNTELEIKEGVFSQFPDELAQFDNRYIHGYLLPKLRLMRLYKEGDIRLPVKYYYTIENNDYIKFMSSTEGNHISTYDYNILDSEYEKLNEFISKNTLPLINSLSDLAFVNFENSYETPNKSLSFISLMISLEILLNPSDKELEHRISRNLAVLLGKTKEESEDIYNSTKKLYNKRSKLVHTGNSKIITDDDLLKLRSYVRKSIIKINKININLKQLHKILDTTGFGCFDEKKI